MKNKIILIIFILITLIYLLTKNKIISYFVLKIFKNCKYGSFEIIHNEKSLIKVVNDNYKLVKVFIKNPEYFFVRIYEDSDLGLGELYMEEEWTSDDILLFLTYMALNINNKDIPKSRLLNVYSKNNKVDEDRIKHHYDVGNDFYLTFLTDELSAYTCGIWLNSNDTLNDAQYRKVNIIIKKLNIKPNHKILDMGCGWGKIANYVSKTTKCNVTGVTLSDEQVKYANENYDKNVKIIKMHYLDLLKDKNNKFDYIYCIGLLEHVRYENYNDFFGCIKQILKPNCNFLLHTIINTEPKNDPSRIDKSFISEYIFPGGQIPNNDWITDSIIKNDLSLVHVEIFGGQHYAETLKHWRMNMLKNKDFIIKKYGKQLLNKYDFYLAICEAGFRANKLSLGHYLIKNDNINNLSNNFIYL